MSVKTHTDTSTPIAAWPVISEFVERLHVRLSWEDLLIDAVAAIGRLPGVGRAALYIADTPGSPALTLAASAGFGDEPPAMFDAEPGQGQSEAVRERLRALYPDRHPAAEAFGLRLRGSPELGALWIDAPALDEASWSTTARLLAGWIYAARDVGERILREHRQTDRRVARSLLERLRAPVEERPAEGVRAYCRHWSCRDVGGDFWDVQPDADGCFFLIGECTGSGLPTVLDIVDVLYRLRGSWARREPLADMLAAVNRRLVEHTHRGRMASVCLGRVDRSAGVLHLARSGGLSTFWRSGGVWHDLAEDGGAPLGVLASLPVKEVELPWAGDNALVCCTSGVYQTPETGEARVWERTTALCRLITPGRTGPDVPWGSLLADRLASALGPRPSRDDATIFAIEHG